MRQYGLVPDYYYNTLYSHVLKKSIPCVLLSTGHLGIRLDPVASDDSPDDNRQQILEAEGVDKMEKTVPSTSLNPQQSQVVSQRPPSLSDQDSTGNDDLQLLRTLCFPKDSQLWTRCDQGAKSYRTTLNSGPLWKNVVARMALDDDTNELLALECVQHMTDRPS